MRGELTSGQIVVLILAIAGFIVLGVFLWSLKNVADGGAQACKLSALTRASLPNVVKQVPPLACTTEKICLSARGNCDESMAGEEITRIKLPKKPNEAARMIEATAAEAMYRCWDMMGKGQLDISSAYWSSRNVGGSAALGAPLCVICSRVALDSAVPKEVVRYVDFQHYIQSTKVPGTTLTYLQALSDKQVTAFPAVEGKIINQIPEARTAEGDPIGTLGPQGDQFAIVFMQIKSASWTDSMKSIAQDLFIGSSVVAGGSFYLAPVTTTANLYRLFDVVAKNWRVVSVGAIGLATGVSLNTFINAKANAALAAGYCGTYSNAQGQDTSQGCSIVQAVPYDAKAINQLCGGNIEGAA